MMTSKKISIITINYNNAEGLQKTIDSVINQSYRNFEFIIVDGNSTDGSKEILLKNSNNLTHWVSEPDRGIYHAMNKGVNFAGGEYLLFLNSGDCLYDINVLERASALITNEHDIYYGDIIYDEIYKQEKRTFPEKLSFGFFFEHNLSHQASFIKSKLFKGFLYNEDYKIVSDWEFFICNICKFNVPYKHLDLVITTYDATGLSSNINNHPLMYEEREKTIKKYFPLFEGDYQTLSLLKSKRTLQVLYIKEHNIAWRVLKGLISLILIFLPKKVNEKNKSH